MFIKRSHIAHITRRYERQNQTEQVYTCSYLSVIEKNACAAGVDDDRIANIKAGTAIDKDTYLFTRASTMAGYGSLQLTRSSGFTQNLWFCIYLTIVTPPPSIRFWISVLYIYVVSLALTGRGTLVLLTGNYEPQSLWASNILR